MAARMTTLTVALALGAAAVLPGCSSAESGGNAVAPSGLPTAPVTVAGEKFTMELALDEPSRIHGLSGRESIDPQGGMLFVFPSSMRREFVMRDCPVPIDIAFLDASGRVVAVHEMTPEPPQREGETDIQYEYRLKRYPSRFPAQFAVETAGGRLAALGLKEGDKIQFDVEGLKRRAR
ncbi:MAG: DUF192 domain-containing protein [Phycisphaerales bacterium]